MHKTWVENLISIYDKMQGAFRIISNGSERISDKSSIQLFIYLSTKITFVMLCTTRFEDQERVFSGFYFLFFSFFFWVRTSFPDFLHPICNIYGWGNLSMPIYVTKISFFVKMLLYHFQSSDRDQMKDMKILHSTLSNRFWWGNAC